MGAVYARGRVRTPRVWVEVGARGRALRVDGSFASWYAPGSPLTGSVWDALAAPLLWLPPARRRSVLILGLGGGSAARLLRAIAPRARLVGVERDRQVIRAARRWFDLDALALEVVESDALAYLRRARRRFDLVIEDVFVGRGRALRKPEGLTHPGLALAARRCAPGGLVVCNTLDESGAVARALAGLFPALLCVEIEDYDNRVLVAGPAGLCARGLRAAVTSHPILSRSAARLRFRRLSGARRAHAR
jgi:SAM-dependent methyltransferase